MAVFKNYVKRQAILGAVSLFELIVAIIIPSDIGRSAVLIVFLLMVLIAYSNDDWYERYGE